MMKTSLTFLNVFIQSGVCIRAFGKLRKNDSFINNVNSKGAVSVVHLGTILIPVKPDHLMISNDINSSKIDDTDGKNDNFNVENYYNLKKSDSINCGVYDGINDDSLVSTKSPVRTGRSVSTERPARTKRPGSTERPVSNTAVVEELINRVVLPSIYLSKEITLKVYFICVFVYALLYIYTYHVYS